MKCNLEIDNVPFSYEIEGDFFWGNDEVLFEKDSDTIEKSDWKRDGFSILNLFSESEFKKIKDGITRLLEKIISEETHQEIVGFSLSKYHHCVNDQDHDRVINRTRNLSYEDMELDSVNLCKVVSEYLGKKVITRNKKLEKDIVILRVSRPNSLDINPLHRDGYLEVWQRTINLWIPIEGCNEKSSLPLIPGSHLWNEKIILRTESKGARINGNVYHVPGVVNTNYGLKLIRPNPGITNALIFTPYLIHGSAINQLEDFTRVSLELRLPFFDS